MDACNEGKKPLTSKTGNFMKEKKAAQQFLLLWFEMVMSTQPLYLECPCVMCLGCERAREYLRQLLLAIIPSSSRQPHSLPLAFKHKWILRRFCLLLYRANDFCCCCCCSSSFVLLSQRLFIFVVLIENIPRYAHTSQLRMAWILSRYGGKMGWSIYLCIHQ